MAEAVEETPQETTDENQESQNLADDEGLMAFLSSNEEEESFIRMHGKHMPQSDGGSDFSFGNKEA